MLNSATLRMAFLTALVTVGVFGGPGKARGNDTTGSAPANAVIHDIPPLGGMGGHGTGGMLGHVKTETAAMGGAVGHQPQRPAPGAGGLPGGTGGAAGGAG